MVRIYWSLPLPGPFRIGGTVWRSRRRRQVYSGTLPGWECHHEHRTPEAALECAQRESRRRAR